MTMHTYLCPLCKHTTSSAAKASAHAIEEHPTTKPALIMRDGRPCSPGMLLGDHIDSLLAE